MAKRKWYRISISLAAKCRVGFALAVLLTIGAALFVPYRWMDRLLEQGKQELARAEVQHLLERHFRQVNDPAIAVNRPPLLIGAGQDKSVKPARWQELHTALTSDRVGASVPVAEENVGDQIDLEQLIKDRPLTEWIRLPSGLGYEILAEEAAAIQAPQEEPGENIGENQTSGDSNEQVGPESGSNSSNQDTPPRAIDQVPGDSFVKEGVIKFLRDRDRHVIFRLRETINLPTELDQNGRNSDTITEPNQPAPTPSALDEQGSIRQLLAYSAPSRYLRAVRVETGCLKSSCHGGAETAEPSLPVQGPPKLTEGELVGVISVILPAGQTSTTLLFNRIFIVIAGLLASIIAVVTFYLITQRFILQPVRSLREAAAQVMVPTDDAEDTEVLKDDDALQEGQQSWQNAIEMTEKIRTGDEFERLAQAFNQMLGRLKLAHDRLRETNRALDLQLGELQAKNIALFESNKLKSEFLANVSHELRTPLNAIIGFAEIVQEQAQNKDHEHPKITRYSENILTSGRGLLSLINNLLDLARIEAGKVEVRWELCSVQEIFEALLSFTRPLIEEKKLQVKRHIDPNLELIETDGGKLQQILFNLLSNAIKFTPKKGRIEINAQSIDAEYIQISIADTGVGIAQEQRELIFEKFRQVDGSVTREHSGTGLGLAIVKELLEVLGGAITIDGQIGKGSVFTITLPKKRNRIIIP